MNGKIYIGLVLALLAVPMIANGVLIAHATGDPSFAVESDYYRKAAQWDEHRGWLEDSQKSGWTVTSRLTPTGLTLTVTDSHGAVIPGIHWRYEAIPIARANARRTGTLAADPDGRYSSPGDFAPPGLWEIRAWGQRDTQGPQQEPQRFYYNPTHELRGP